MVRRITLGIVIGTALGVAVAVVWVSINWILTARSGTAPVLPYVRYIYTITATWCGFWGAVLGGVVGAAVGLNHRRKRKNDAVK